MLNALLQLDASKPEPWTHKGAQYQGLQFNEAAIRCYRRAQALQPDPKLDIAMACAHHDSGRHGEALLIYDALVGATTDRDILEQAHGNRANSHAALGNIDAAASDYEEAIRRNPRRAIHYRNYALMFGNRKRWEQAESIVARGLNVVTRHDALPLLIEKAKISNELQRADAGLAAADEALALSPCHPRALYQRAWALGMLGRLHEARVSLMDLLALEPKSESAKTALQKVDAAIMNIEH